MAWIESHQSLGTHLKLLRLARALGIHRAQAVGHLHYLWWWALDSAPSGDLSSLTPDEIAEAAQWPGDAAQFALALRESGWIDQNDLLHGWQQYVGRILTYREANRKRQSRFREKARNGYVTPPVTRDVTQSVTPASQPDVTASNGRPYRTVPTVPTVPTVQESASPGVDAPPEGTHAQDAHTDSCWPTLAEVLTRADLRGIAKECAEKWWHEHDARGGCDRHGQPLRRWESALIAFATSWRSFEAQRQTRNASRPAPQAQAPADHSKGFFG